MITNDQITAAINQHNAEADALDQLARHLRGSVCDYLRKQDGKQISKRLYLPLCAVAGLKAEQDWKGATFYRDAEWKADLNGHTHGAIGYISGVRVKIGNRGAFQDIPLIPREHTDKLDAAATVARLEAIASACEVWAEKERYAASQTEYAAAEYNKIQRAAVALLEKLDADMLAAFPGHHHGGISILCGIGSKYHTLLSNLNWEDAQ
jgi:hypothetical protein